MKTEIEQFAEDINKAMSLPGNQYRNVADVCERYTNPKYLKVFKPFKIGNCLEVKYDRSRPYMMEVNHRSSNGQGWMMQLKGFV